MSQCSKCGGQLTTAGMCENTACLSNTTFIAAPPDFDSGIRIATMDCPMCANYNAAHKLAQERVAEFERRVAKAVEALETYCREVCEMHGNCAGQCYMNYALRALAKSAR